MSTPVLFPASPQAKNSAKKLGMFTPILIPVSADPLAPSRRLHSSVPSSPTSENPALRSSKGFLSAAPSPRKGPACPCPCVQGAAAVLQAQLSGQHTTKCAASEQDGQTWVGGSRLVKAALWVTVVVASNYLGHSHPVLWSARERAEILDAVSAPGTRQMSNRGRMLKGLPTYTPATLPLHLSYPQVFSLENAQQKNPGMVYTAPSTPPDDVSSVEDGISDEALLRSDPIVNEDTTNVLSLIQAGGKDPESDNSRHQKADSNGVGPTLLSRAASSGSPYVAPWSISLVAHKSCTRIFPRHLAGAQQGPITFVGDLLRKKQRMLLVIPRHGLGNSLRGYVSSFVYAALSGRRLVRFHGAEHAKVFDTLCHAFDCGFDGMESEGAPGGPMGLFKQLDKLNPVDLNSKFRASPQVLTSLRATRTLFVTRSAHFFDGFWHNFPQVRQCIYDSFGCSSAWCVRSRAMQALVGAPTPLLADVISKVLKKHTDAGDVPAQRSIDDMFDVALHFRTRPAAIESKNPGKETKQAQMRIGCGSGNSGDAKQYLQSCLWNCLGGIMQQLEAKRAEKGRPLQILLATDNEQLRPAFVARLAAYGTVFYSSGVIVHSSKSASEEGDRLPTMAEFHLMSRSHMILEAGSYISTFAYFSGLLGNGTLAGIDWRNNGAQCGLKYIHKGMIQEPHAYRSSQ